MVPSLDEVEASVIVLHAVVVEEVLVEVAVLFEFASAFSTE